MVKLIDPLSSPAKGPDLRPHVTPTEGKADHAVQLATQSCPFLTLFFFFVITCFVLEMKQSSRAGAGAASVLIGPDQIIWICLR